MASDSPRTDAVAFTLPVAEMPGGEIRVVNYVSADFARELERSLAESQRDLAAAREQLKARDEQLRLCNICGFTVDMAHPAQQPSIEWSTAGRGNRGLKDDTEDTNRLGPAPHNPEMERLRTELSAAQSALAEAKKDTERLDWLEEHSYRAAPNTPPKVYVIAHSSVWPPAIPKQLREAIDTVARLSAPDGKEGK